MMYIKKVVLLGFMFFMAVTSSQAQVLYGAATGQESGDRPSNLYMIDPATGNSTLIGPIGFNGVTGLEFLPDGRLIGSANGDTEDAKIAVLININPSTGKGTLIGELGSNTNPGECGRMPDIAFDSVSGNLYGYSDFCNGPDLEGLYVINPTNGNVSFIGPSGFFSGGNGLAVEDSGIIYGAPNDADGLITISPFSGQGTLIPASSGNMPNAINAMDFNPITGVLYGSFRDFDNILGNGVRENYLVTINTLNGINTVVGPTVFGLDAIVFADDRAFSSNVPTLSEYGLIITAVLLLAGAVVVLRKRQKLTV